MRLSHRFITMMLILLLLCIFSAIAMLYPLASRPLVRSGDEWVVERAQADASLIFRHEEKDSRTTFPIVMQLANRTCVELRATRADSAGNYVVCYDRRTGQKVEERADGGF